MQYFAAISLVKLLVQMEKINQSFKKRIDSGPRALELMGILGIKSNS